eukprot:3385358-Pleurochrysis_carterae.AAC.1
MTSSPQSSLSTQFSKGAVGTYIKHNFAVSQAVAVQVYRLLCDAHDASRVLSRTGLAAVTLCSRRFITRSESQIPRTTL